MSNKKFTGYPDSLAVCNEAADLCQKVYGWRPDVYDKRVSGKSFTEGKGITNHHTAAGPGSKDAPSLSTVQYGRPDLEGPLCNILVGFSGALYAISNGAANHPGKVDRTQYDKIGVSAPMDTAGSDDDNVNAKYGLWGFEHEGTAGSDMSEKNYQSIACLNAASMKHFGWTDVAATVHNHSTLTTRKVDAQMDVPHLGWNGSKKWWPEFTQNHLWKDTANALGVAPPPPGGGSSGGGSQPYDNNANFHRNLSKKDPYMRGEDVKWVQGKVGASPADGIFGNDTANAVGAWQSANGLEADKVVGPATAAAMGMPGAGSTPPSGGGGGGGSAFPLPSGHWFGQKSSNSKNHSGSGLPADHPDRVAIKKIQGKVNKSQDGLFGPDTENGVKAFQSANGLAADGDVGVKTWTAMGI